MRMISKEQKEKDSYVCVCVSVEILREVSQNDGLWPSEGAKSLDFQFPLMEGVKAEVWHQIIMNFYRKNMDKGKLYTVKYFATLDVGKMQVNWAIDRVESGETSPWSWSRAAALTVQNPGKASRQGNRKQTFQSRPMRDPMPLSTDLLVMNVLI